MYDRRLAIESVTRLGPGQFVLAFESREIATACRPGQFVMISVADAIDPLLRRPMAIYRILRDDDGAPRGFTMVIEVVGRGTALLEQMVGGERLWALGPVGVPFALPEAGGESGEHLLVMGGVGCAPFPFVADELLSRGHTVRAFVGARTAGALLCVEEFEELSIPVAISTDDGTAGHHGFVTEPLQEYLDGAEGSRAQLYACGPTPMMRAVHDIAVGKDLPLQVSFEAPMACGIGICLSCVVRLRDDDETDGAWHYARCCREGPVFDSRRLLW